ncbi:ATP-NAD kinase family protein [Hoeflea ulvae]|uniref:NAD(+)/NADH kinase n=1 Tax=Hoeflea ulvae TaxID=2983764 RepID=A0ABT3YDD8_9HYPH|nr:NAD(+)/NADH kinase [Hoeflea ulvae]MCY0093794.1 NAD(+)/NADH kinase [Hoeflea ulvae]
MRIGLIVNPVAGLGGAVGLKGTDGPDAVAEALRRGAVAQSGPRVRRALAVLARRCPGTTILAAPGQLGADWTADLDLTVDAVPSGDSTGTARDTRQAIAAFGAADLVLFAGGDGTARDVAACMPEGAAMLGIPSGVKMHSGVFAISPEHAGQVLADIIVANDRVGWTDDAEIMDIDEVALRAGHLAPRLFGHARVPVVRNRMQAAKGGPRRDCSAALASAAFECATRIEPGALCIVGPGTSACAFANALNQPSTLLGVDVFRDGKCLLQDATASQIEALIDGAPVRIVLGITGQQGFLLGRGNQQISAAVIRRAGREGLRVLATDEKLAALPAPCLFVDTGDPMLDAELAGFIRVQTDRGKFMMMRVVAS